MPDDSGTSASTVEGLMSSPVATTTPTKPLLSRGHDARAQGRVPRRPQGREGRRHLHRAGQRSLCRRGRRPTKETVGEWMTPDPDTVAPDEPVGDAFQSLSDHGYRHIPVVSDGELEGIVSMRDLMRVARIQPVDLTAGEVPRASRAWPSRRPRSATSAARKGSSTTASTAPSNWPKSARWRTSGISFTRASFRTRRSATRSSPRSSPAQAPGRVKELCRASPTSAITSCLSRPCATRYSLFAGSQDFKASLEWTAKQLRLQGLQVVCSHTHAADGAVPAAQRRRSRGPASRTFPSRPTTST